MKRDISRLALLAALATAQAIAPVSMAQAQEAEDLGTIVLSALRTATERLRSGVSVSVVTAADIAKDRSTTVADYLTRLPGVSLTHYGPFGNTAELRVRGLGSGYLTVMIDGIRVNDASNPKNIFDFGSLLTADIGRIELLRGSQSALWGNSAVGGVISISTFGAEDEAGFVQKAQLEAGSYGTARLGYGLSYRDERAEFALNATRFHTDGYSTLRSGREADGGDAERLSFSGRYRLSEGLTLGGAIFTQNTRQEYDGSDAATYAMLDADNEQRRRETGARLFAEVNDGDSKHVFEVSVYDINRRFDEEIISSGVSTGRSQNAYDGRRISFGWQASTAFSDQLSFVYGLDHSEDEVSYVGGYGSLPADQVSTRISGAFGQVIWSPRPDLDLSASLRVDEDSNFGTFTTGRVAVAWQANEALTLSASAARGYRAPTIDERFGDYTSSGWVIGNPDLNPEESWSYELGAEWALASGGSLSATLFRIALDNRIQADFATAPPSYVNASGATVLQGLELGATAALSDLWTLQGAYTYTDGKGPDGSRVSGVPYHTFALSVDGEITDKLSAHIGMRLMSGWQDVFSRRDMGAFALFNAQASYQLSENSEVYLRIENLSDRDYEISDGYGTSGRAGYIGLSHRF
ncbi:TonB-dependent receptor plug domain-containing protein [Pseudogemmobacter faecipullorum]|uniref:TonB-dependent receptor n=1 Tax=Pseudogemmobacter faecipullorum TaxID=2755041 RepID=A0ABS8CMP7_9RHOB|nr:TonB-dependent receptor [Pseudogemmobacter faecipullorum]MCB5410649.1 TonB-dependent receptor [Pseudogemmobacter faecipullorum]